MDLNSLKDRTVACFSISAKSQNRLDVAIKWLSDLKPKKWLSLYGYNVIHIDDEQIYLYIFDHLKYS